MVKYVYLDRYTCRKSLKNIYITYISEELYFSNVHAYDVRYLLISQLRLQRRCNDIRTSGPAFEV